MKKPIQLPLQTVLLAILLACGAAAPALAAGDSITVVPAADQRKVMLVLNLPYSATQTKTTRKVLGDGNEITKVEISKVYRDSLGRTRTDTLDKDGAIVRISLMDAGGMYYSLDPARKTATRASVLTASVGAKPDSARVSGEGVTPERLDQFKSEVEARRRTEIMRAPIELGEREIEGLKATGREVRFDIAADAAGNSRPIEIVSEFWSSSALKVTLLQKRSDPRTEESVTALTDIVRGEPDAALFEIPDDYKRSAPTLDVSLTQ